MLRKEKEHPRLLRASKQLKISLKAIAAAEPANFKLPLLGKEAYKEKSLPPSRKEPPVAPVRSYLDRRQRGYEYSIQELTTRHSMDHKDLISVRGGLSNRSALQELSVVSLKKASERSEVLPPKPQKAGLLQIVSSGVSVPPLWNLDQASAKTRTPIGQLKLPAVQPSRQPFQPSTERFLELAAPVSSRTRIDFGPLIPNTGRHLEVLLHSLNPQGSVPSLQTAVFEQLGYGCFAWVWQALPEVQGKGAAGQAASDLAGHVRRSIVGLAIGTLQIDLARGCKVLNLLHLKFKATRHHDKLVMDLKQLATQPIDGHHVDSLSVTLRQEGWLKEDGGQSPLHIIIQDFTHQGFQVTTTTAELVKVTLDLRKEPETRQPTEVAAKITNELAPVSIITACRFNQGSLMHPEYDEVAEELVGFHNSRI